MESQVRSVRVVLPQGSRRGLAPNWILKGDRQVAKEQKGKAKFTGTGIQSTF